MSNGIFIQEVKAAAGAARPGATATRALTLFRMPDRALTTFEAGPGALTVTTGSARALFIPMTSRALVPMGSAETRALALAGPAASTTLALFRPVERQVMVAGRGGPLISQLISEFDAAALARKPRFTKGHETFFKESEDALQRGKVNDSALAELKDFGGEYKRQWQDQQAEDPLRLYDEQRPAWANRFPAVFDFLLVAVTAVGGFATGWAWGGTIEFTVDMVFAYRNSTMTDDQAYTRLIGRAKAKMDTWLTAVLAAGKGELKASDIAKLYPDVDVAALSDYALAKLTGKESDLLRSWFTGVLMDFCKAEAEAVAVLLRSKVRSIDAALEGCYESVKKALDGLPLIR